MLSAHDGFHFEFFPPGEALAPYCHTLYAVACEGDGIDNVVPSYSPQLVLFGSGEAHMRFADGTEDRAGGVVLVSQIEEAAHVRIDPPALMLGASLTILGWLALGAPSLANHANRLRPADELVNPGLVNRLSALGFAMGKDFASCKWSVDDFASIIASGMNALPDSTIEFVAKVKDWLDGAFDPKLPDLHARFDLSPRQIQRLCRKWFGRPPSALAKRHRAVRAATLLTMDKLPAELEAEIFDAYYDQAHLIRDIRRYTGKTPTRLLSQEPSLGVESLKPEANANAKLFARMGAGNTHDIE